MAIYPTREQIRTLLEHSSDAPVVMVNLLRFKPRADAPDAIEDGSVRYDAVALVDYPSRKVFVEIATSAEVAEIGVHRAAGLESQWLLATTAGRF